MFFIYLGAYILFLLVMWGFFGVAWVHATKFKNFSSHITFVTRSLFVFLVTMSILGVIVIYLLANSGISFSLKNQDDILIENQNYY